MKLILLLLGFIILGCGKEKPSKVMNAQNISTHCFNPVNNMSGCCSEHKGLMDCGVEGSYQFTYDFKAICRDGSISIECSGSKK